MIQYLRFFDLASWEQKHTPGDLRFWRAFESMLPGLEFLKYQAVCVEWADSTSEESLPGLNDWVSWLCPPGLSSLGLLESCEQPALLRRRKGKDTTVLESIVFEFLAKEGFPTPNRIWECSHFEVQGEVEFDSLRNGIQKLKALGSKSGLLDVRTEEVRLFAPGESWKWSSEEETSGGNPMRASVDELLAEWQSYSYSTQPFDSLRRQYVAYDLTPAREKLRKRTSKALFTRLDEIMLDSSSSKISSVARRGHPGIYKLSRSKYSDSSHQLDELCLELDAASAFRDQPVSLTCWGEQPMHRARTQGVQFRRFLHSPLEAVKVDRLFAIKPLHNLNHLAHRRLEVLFDSDQNILSQVPWRFSGRESWAAALRSMMMAHDCWQIKEKDLRVLLHLEQMRSADHELIVFASAWSFEALKKVFDEYSLSLYSIGTRVDGGEDGLKIVGDADLKVVPWVDVIPAAELKGESSLTESLVWNVPDQKTPTYGFEKVSMFPDQYLLRILKTRIASHLHREVEWNHRSHSKAREVRMRNAWDEPLKSQRRSGGGEHLLVEAFKSGHNIGGIDPKMAAVWATEFCLRELVCRGVDVKEPTEMAFSLNQPQLTADKEKNSFNYATYTKAIEGMIDVLGQLPQLRLASVEIEQSSSPLYEYNCEPLVYLRGESTRGKGPIMSGFRMSGEILYSVGPRPVFMDAGSRILPFVRVVSNHVTQIHWEQQMELYQLLLEAQDAQMLSAIRPIGHGGLVETLLDMSLAGGIGVEMKPGLTTIDMFSGAPGRFIVSVLPQDEKNFESLMRSEWTVPLGKTGGERYFGLSLEQFIAMKMGEEYRSLENG